jgi:hypothetical protein
MEIFLNKVSSFGNVWIVLKIGVLTKFFIELDTTTSVQSIHQTTALTW